MTTKTSEIDIQDEAVKATLTTPKKFNRDEIRAAVLNAEDESAIVEAFGVQIEVRAPSLADLVQYRNYASDDAALARAIRNVCFVPGTMETVFEDADIDMLQSKSFGKDMKKLNKAVNAVLGGDEELTKAIEDNTKSPEA